MEMFDKEGYDIDFSGAPIADPARMRAVREAFHEEGKVEYARRQARNRPATTNGRGSSSASRSNLQTGGERKRRRLAALPGTERGT